MIKVAALYVMETSVYNDLDSVDPWPESRDARKYRGPGPVVSHPPCSAWSRLWAMSGTRKKAGDGDTCGLRAIAQVREFGGVLEQPAWSRLWLAGYLPKPGLTDLWGGAAVEVNQSEWGHPGTKPTWLYIVGGAQLEEPPQPGRVGKTLHYLSKRQKFATPRLFAEALVSVARRCEVNAKAVC